jgi:hypothetical protein
MKVLDAASASLLKPESSPDCPPGWVSGYGSCGEIGAKEPVATDTALLSVGILTHGSRVRRAPCDACDQKVWSASKWQVRNTARRPA